MKHVENLEELIHAADLNQSIIEIDNFISELCAYGEEMDVLSEPQKFFYYNQSIEREVNNGGFNQYFFNSSGDFAHQTIDSLKLIGATITADILQKAINQFPDGFVPVDRNERQIILEQIEDTANEIWEELDNRFFEYADDLNALNIEYIKQNMGKF